jgi:hypothetical protein
MIKVRVGDTMLPGIEISLINNSKESLKYSIVDVAENEMEIVTLGPGKKAVYGIFYFSYMITVRDSTGNIVNVDILTADTKQTISVSQKMVDWAKIAKNTTYPFLRSFDTGIQAGLTIANKSIIPLNIFWIDPDGKEQVIEGFDSVAAGKTVSITSGPTHPWRLRDQFGNIILEYIMTEAAKQTVTITNDVIIASYQSTMTKK